MQGKLKSAVLSFGKLIVAWDSDVASISSILSAIAELDNYVESIKRSFQPRLISIHIAKLREGFEDLETKLLFNMYNDREKLYRQLHVYRKRLSDVVVAVNLKSQETLQIVLNEDPVQFSSGCIFTVDHALDIQQLAINYCREFKRKEILMREFLQITEEDRSIVITGQEGAGTIGQSSNRGKDSVQRDAAAMLALWADNYSESCIDSGLVNKFQIENGLT